MGMRKEKGKHENQKRKRKLRKKWGIRREKDGYKKREGDKMEIRIESEKRGEKERESWV
jgi:hypothetical protein